MIRTDAGGARGRLGRAGVLAALAMAAAASLAACSATAPTPPAPSTVTSVVAAPAAPGGPGAATASPAATDAGGGLTPPNCPTSSLSVSLGSAEGAAGTVYRPLVFTNTGSSTCQLRGYPGVSYVAGDDGHQVGPAATEDGARADQVNLAPGQAAHATLALAEAGNYDAARCRPTDVRGLRVYPPGDTASAYVPYPGHQGCAGDVTLLRIRTMQAGAS